MNRLHVPSYNKADAAHRYALAQLYDFAHFAGWEHAQAMAFRWAYWVHFTNTVIPQLEAFTFAHLERPSRRDRRRKRSK